MEYNKPESTKAKTKIFANLLYVLSENFKNSWKNQYSIRKNDVWMQ